MKFTPETWQRILGVKIIDPDGWRTGDFDANWQEPISFNVFMDKFNESTVRDCPLTREQLFEIACNRLVPNIRDIHLEIRRLVAQG